MRRLIFDTANILFRVAAGHGKTTKTFESPEDRAGLALHITLMTIKKYVKLYKPDQIAVTFEGVNNWRKTYTKSDKCLSGKVYKANRIKDSSMEPFYELIAAFKDLVQNHTSLICLTHPLLEGDDLFAGYVQRYAALGDTVIGISGDKDFVQLLKFANFQLINPDNGKARTALAVCGHDSINYFMFEKCIRGDKGDNVASAFPRVRSDRLLKCMSDEYEMTKIMNECWNISDPDTGSITTFKVSELFQENKLLMDLEGQPDDIKQLIADTIDHALVNNGRFNFFSFQKFCGKYKLDKISENASSFAEMFSVSSKSAIKEPKRNTLLVF